MTAPTSGASTLRNSSAAGEGLSPAPIARKTERDAARAANALRSRVQQARPRVLHEVAQQWSELVNGERIELAHSRAEISV
jgi:hypothetical protein